MKTNLLFSQYNTPVIINKPNSVEPIQEGIANFCKVNSRTNNSGYGKDSQRIENDVLKCKADSDKAKGDANKVNDSIIAQNVGFGASGSEIANGYIPDSDSSSTVGLLDRDTSGKLINSENKNTGAEERYYNRKEQYGASFTNTINLGIGIFAAIYFITKYR
jgi:hypothetical protein